MCDLSTTDMAKYAKQFKIRKCSFPAGEDKQSLLRHSCGPSKSSGIISVSDRSTVSLHQQD